MSGDLDPVLLPLSFLKVPKSQKTQEQNQIKLTQASATWVNELGPRAALGEVVADRDECRRRDWPPRWSRMRPRPSCTSPRSLGTESGTCRTGPGSELAMALRESKAYWYLKFERNLGFVYVILGCRELSVFGWNYLRDINRVLETRFPCRCHLKKVPH